MNLVQSIRHYISEMLRISGSGMKVMLFDTETLATTSIVFSMSEIMQQEVYLCENISTLSTVFSSNGKEDHTDKVNSMKHLKCICFLRPVRDNITFLCRELKAPHYSSYYLFFSHAVSKQDLKRLAEADVLECVKEIQEMFADFLVLGPHFYSIDVSPTFCNMTWRHDILLRGVEGLTAVLLSLKKVPVIRYLNNSEAASRLAQSVASLISREASLFDFRQTDQTPLLLILDRREDPVTPLLNQWTYEAMMHELLHISNNRIDLSHVPDVKPDLKEVNLSLEFDDFLRNNLYANFGEIGQNIKQLMEEFQACSQEQHSKLNSIHDMKTFLENYPAFRRMSGTVAKHVTIIGELSRLVKEGNLLEVSQCEQELVCHGEDHADICQRIRALLPNPNVKSFDALRLVLLYALRYENHPKRELPNFIDLLHKRSESVDTTYIQRLLDFAGQRRRSQELFETVKLGSVGAITKRLFKELKGVDNIYTQHQPLLSTILDQTLRGKLKETVFPLYGKNVSHANDRHMEVIVFILGGVTYQESLVVHTINQNAQNKYPPGVNVIVGGTTILNSRSFLSEVRSATSHEEHAIANKTTTIFSNYHQRN